MRLTPLSSHKIKQNRDNLRITLAFLISQSKVNRPNLFLAVIIVNTYAQVHIYAGL